MMIKVKFEDEEAEVTQPDYKEWAERIYFRTRTSSPDLAAHIISQIENDLKQAQKVGESIVRKANEQGGL